MFEAARAAFLDGVQAFEAGDTARAESLFTESLRLVPGRPSTLVNLAAVHERLGRHAQALASIEQALAAQPEDLAAWLDQGRLLQVLERPHDALRSYERVLALDATHHGAWTQRGSLLKDMGQLDEAAQCFRQALAHGGDAELNRYFLAAAEAGRAAAGSAAVAPAPRAAPPGYVQALFDSYAESFDKHLVETLGYRAPEQLVELLRSRVPGRRWQAALDLGCGTGLLGPLLSPLAEAVDGVDLSPRMLDKARARGVYRELQLAEVADHLARTERRYDLVVAADVFIYVGDLGDVFAGASRVLERDGHFAFSVEEAQPGTPRFELRPSSRYAQAEAYLQELAAAHGFAWQAQARVTLRHEQRRPIPGLLVPLQRR